MQLLAATTNGLGLTRKNKLVKQKKERFDNEFQQFLYECGENVNGKSIPSFDYKNLVDIFMERKDGMSTSKKKEIIKVFEEEIKYKKVKDEIFKAGNPVVVKFVDGTDKEFVSVRGAVKALGVAYSTVYDYLKIHGVYSNDRFEMRYKK